MEFRRCGLLFLGEELKEYVELMTPQETADFLRIPLKSLRELTRNRTQVRSRSPLPCFKLHKKAIRFDKQTVVAWVTELSMPKAKAAKGGAR